ncbi:MAG TPA: protein O-GlcNAcase, partial [Thermotogota bacterium]|nr:protein O-GlcNAcase [Thermotogota bacterium]
MSGFQIRGVVEGFYGSPWSMEERGRILHEMARLGMNLYVYAPKNDLLHRHQWETPYPPEAIREFKNMVEEGKKLGVSVAMALSPGLTLTYGDSGKIDALVRKYLSFSAIGVGDFCLFLDDIPLTLQKESDRAAFSDLAEAQVFFTNQVYERLKNLANVATFMFCPTQYCGDSRTDYLEKIGTGMHPDIDVLWTGPQVCSQKIPFEDAEGVSRTLRRKVVYWDNYPVNDGSMAPELHMGPYTGRDQRLPLASRGFLINPMNQAMASIPVLKNIAAYLNAPAIYDPQSAWEEALEEFAPDCVDSLKLFGQMNLISPLNPKGEGMACDQWIASYW